MPRQREGLLWVVGQYLAIALFHGTLYFRLKPDAIQPRLSLLYYACLFSLKVTEAMIPE